MNKYEWSSWNQLATISSRTYVCGYCGVQVGSAHGYFSNQHRPNLNIFICTNCGHPTFIDGVDGKQTPGPMIGKDIDKLPSDIATLYNEIRDSIKNGNDTSAVLLARKLIMHLAVDKAGATEGEKFVQYVDHLKKSGYVPPSSDSWLTKIKNAGNEKNHELKLATSDEAIIHQKFIELLLSFMYEYADEEPITDSSQETPAPTQ